MYYFLILAAVGLDQLIKFFIRTNMEVHQTIPVIEDVFHITYVQNTGAAFSMFSGHTSVLAVITIIATLAILFYMHKVRSSAHSSLLWSLALIIAGGIGNIIDRISLKYVVDFLDFRIWPVFNIADICVCVGCGLLIFYAFVIEPKLQKETDISKNENN